MKNHFTRARKRTEDLPPEHKLQAQFALAAFSTLKAREIAYISIPITSGKRLYDYMDKQGFKTQDEAKADHDAFFKHVVEPNLADGVKTSNAWAEKIDGTVVAPAEFEKKLRGQNAITWGQDAFMGMWIPLIEEKITHMVMVDGWEYSNGSGEEYLQAVLMQLGCGKRDNIKILDNDGQTLPLDKGITLLAHAFMDVHGRGLKPHNMAETLAILLEAEERHASSGKKRGHLPAYDRKEILAVGKQLRDIFSQHYQDIMPVLEKTDSRDFSPINALFRRTKKAPTMRLAA